MEMHLATALLSICYIGTLALGLQLYEDEDEDEKRPRGPSRMRNSCGALMARGAAARGAAARGARSGGSPGLQKQLELKLDFKPQRSELLRASSFSDAEHLFDYKGNSAICPAEDARDMSYEKSKTTPAPTDVEEYDDNDNGGDDDADDPATDDDRDEKEREEEAFIERVSCLLRTIYKNSKQLTEDCKELDRGLVEATQGTEDPASFASKLAKLSKVSEVKQSPQHQNYMVHQDDYSDMDDEGMKGDEKQSMQSFASKLAKMSKVSEAKQLPQHQNYMVHQDEYSDMDDEGMKSDEKQSIESSKELKAADEAKAAAAAAAATVAAKGAAAAAAAAAAKGASGAVNGKGYTKNVDKQPDRKDEDIEALFRYLRMPFIVPSARLIVPPLLQLLARRSELPGTKEESTPLENKRYLQALNELRLARAVHAASAASAARRQRQENRIHLNQNVRPFKENLRRLLSNKAAIEQRLSALLSGGDAE